MTTEIKDIGNNPEEIQALFESMHEVYRKPLSSVFIGDEVQPPLQIATELVLGPTVFARLLTELARRGVLEKIPGMTKLPKGVAPRTTLAKIKDSASPDSIRQFLILARKRITMRRETGHERFRKTELDHACFAYCAAAELAAALVAFDVVTKGSYSQHLEGARREQVLCMGNAAEMALGLGEHERALYFALGAVDVARGLPDKGGLDAVDEGIKAKNLRRVERARSGLST